MNMALAYMGAALGAGITALAAGVGIGLIGAAAMEATGRQPEAAGQIRTSMLIAAALVEGVAFFTAVICLLTLLLK